MTPSGVPPPVINPLVIEIDDQQDAFFSSRSGSIYDDIGLPTAEVENKVRDIEQKLKVMEGFNVIGTYSAEICLVPNVRIPVKLKVPDFEKYKGESDSRIHIRAYYRKMVAYSNDDRFLIIYFKKT